MKTKRWMLWAILGLALVLALAAPSSAQAQNDEYRLLVNKSYGYNAGNQIRGTFRAEVVGDEASIKSVDFMIDGKLMQTVSAPPFKISFQTADYAVGLHDLSAVVTTSDGRSVPTAARSFNFVSPEEEAQGMKNIVLPILGVVLVVMVVGIGAQFLMTGGKNVKSPPPGTRRNYGMAGGTICRHCHRPTPRHIWGINLVAGKLDRCENCGKWSLMMRAPESVLRAAEDAEREMTQPGLAMPEKSEEDKLKEMLDNSRYTDSH